MVSEMPRAQRSNANPLGVELSRAVAPGVVILSRNRGRPPCVRRYRCGRASPDNRSSCVARS